MTMALLLLILAACGPIRGPLDVAQMAGWTGWFHVASGQAANPDTYGERFTPVDLGVTTPTCERVLRAQESHHGPVYVLVHGLQGDGSEWVQAISTLTRAEPSSLWMYRWVPYDERDAIVESFGAGLTRLLQCLPAQAGPVVVLAHSAGGIVVATGASRVAIPATRPHAQVYALTVAAPLAGTLARRRNREGRAEARFMLDLGTMIDGYPPAARGVRVAHLRTSPSADPVMQPSADGHVPNHPAVGVPGAPQLNLPTQLGHDESLQFVAERLVDGAWVDWFYGP